MTKRNPNKRSSEQTVRDIRRATRRGGAMVVNRAFRLAARSVLLVAMLLAEAGLAANPDELLDGLHENAANANFDAYFARFLPDAIFMGTDRSERWSITAFKHYARPIFDEGRGWAYKVVDRHWAGTDSVRWFDETLWNDKYGYCRGTGVVRATEAGWMIAHYSLTFLIPNEMAADITQLTRTVDAEPCCLME